jgi:hypothetical protein
MNRTGLGLVMILSFSPGFAAVPVVPGLVVISGTPWLTRLGARSGGCDETAPVGLRRRGRRAGRGRPGSARWRAEPATSRNDPVEVDLHDRRCVR